MDHQKFQLSRSNVEFLVGKIQFDIFISISDEKETKLLSNIDCMVVTSFEMFGIKFKHKSTNSQHCLDLKLVMRERKLSASKES